MAYGYRTSFTAAAQADREETIVDGRFSSSGDIALADGTATQGAIYFADDKNTGVYSPSNDQIAFTTAGSAALTIANNDATFAGNVGLGISSPTFEAINSVAANTVKGIEIFKDGTDTGCALKLAGDSGTGSKSFSQIGYSGANATAHWANYNTAQAKQGEIILGATGNVQLHYGGATNPSFETTASGAKVTGKLGVNTDPSTTLEVSAGTNKNFNVWSSGAYATGITIGSANDAFSAYTSLEFRASEWYFHNGTEEKVHIDSSGDATFAGNIKMAASKGIQFSPYDEAVSSPGSDSNTLDDYEEGTWTPQFKVGSYWSYGPRHGQYVKIGNTVWVSWMLQWVGQSIGGTSNSGSEAIQISGLPFEVSHTSNVRWVGSLGYNAGINAQDLALNMSEGNDHIALYKKGSGVAESDVVTSGMCGGTGEMIGSAFYNV